MEQFNLNGIKNIIFDLGGVILNIDYNRSVEAFKHLGLFQFEDLYSQARQSNLFDALEVGRISYSDFREEIRIIAKRILTDKQIDDAWNAMLLDLPGGRIRTLRNLKQQYRTFLLSNTNEGHWEYFTKYLQTTFKMDGLEEIFEKVHCSFAIGLHKPNPKAFEFVIDFNGLNPAETLFIDDTLRHVEAARAVGLKVYHLQPGEDIAELFN